MCLVIAMICFTLAYFSYVDANTSSMIINLILGITFSALMIRNIYKTKQERNNN
ncbi:MAG: hypothetical protein U9N30_04250 [Campylobacterota bacterium]|nr:hypothetical protein [Campylobacterota bacterium]